MTVDHLAIRWPLPKSRGGTSGELTGHLGPLPSPRLLGDELRDNQAHQTPARPRQNIRTPHSGRDGVAHRRNEQPGYTKFEVSPSRSASLLLTRREGRVAEAEFRLHPKSVENA